MANLFWIQFSALLWKNWIIVRQHPIVAIVRCVLLPVAYGVFLGYAKVLLHRLNYYGLGDIVPIYSLESQFDGSTALVWTDSTNGTSHPSPADIISRITANFTPNQLAAVKQLDNASAIPAECPLNFNGFSQCFAGLSFVDIPRSDSDNPVNYTIFADAGLTFIDVDRHTSDFEKRILPLQWSIDQAIIELQTGILQLTPLEWPFTNITNEEQKTNIRLSYVRGIRNLIALALIINFIGVAYQIPGAVASDRAMLITAHMKAMGLLDSARILSTHIAICLTYLPAWIAISLIWKYLIFVETNAGLVVAVHLLLGLTLASWSFVIAVPFNSSPQLAAVISAFLVIVFAIFGLVLKANETGVLFVFSLIFPPSFYIFALKAICGYENNRLPTNVVEGDPDNGILLLPLMVAAIVDIFLWPILAVMLERCIYHTAGPTSARLPKTPYLSEKSNGKNNDAPSKGVAISIRNLTKVYRGSTFWSRKKVTAVQDLNLDIPKTGIFVMLGSNGAGKSTAISVVGGLSKITSGTVEFEGGHRRPPRGILGIVPQKNVLFPQLTCLQTLRVWKAIKWSSNSDPHEDLEQLLRDCDLEQKINANAATLSGGQKRKLQLAIGLLGGSKVVLVDECTSGVDALSRRAIWKILLSFHHDRSIVFTTHFLDEADLLGDHIVILAPPGKVVASGSPVALKHDLGEGYSTQVFFNDVTDHEKMDTQMAHKILDSIRDIAPHAYYTIPSPSHICYHLKTRDSPTVIKVLNLLDAEICVGTITAYEILGTTIEDIFLELMNEQDAGERSSLSTISASLNNHVINLPPGRYVSPLRQAFTIFRKRLLIAKRSWLAPILTVAVAVSGSCIPLIFISGRHQLCVEPTRYLPTTSLYFPTSYVVNRTSPSSRILATPPGIISTLGSNFEDVPVSYLPDNATFVAAISRGYHNLSMGGVSLDQDSGSSLIAWDATAPGIRGPVMVNLATNILYNRALGLSGNAPQTPVSIQPSFTTFPRVAAATLEYLRWMFFFGTVMAIYPAFYALYTSKERTSSVQTMQFSNGLSNPIGLWLGHLMFDSISAILLSTIIVIVFATATDQFYGLGFLWVVLVLYGFAGALFAYSLSLMVTSPLAAFALVAGYQFIIFVLYLSSYLFILTFGTVADSSRLITIVHFTTSVVAPVASATRGALVAANLFALACDGQNIADPSGFGSIMRYGGPILYLIVYAFILLGILVWVDSGSRAIRLPKKKKDVHPTDPPKTLPGGDLDADSVSSLEDPLRIIDVSKSFKGKQVVDNVNLSIPKNTIFALLGPNGAGKTTVFNIIRGNIIPDSGDVSINGASIVRHPRIARSSLGVCPQFTAIDAQLTVREHLLLYGRLKGLRRGTELQSSVDAIAEATSLTPYLDRLASKLSGGNQRKLSLAISLLGNPPVVLIDEFSTGVDPRMKRDMWETLRKMAVGKSIVITTHSMEEASAIATNVGILAKHLLATGTPESLAEQYASYEVHFACRTREDVVKARALMALVPGSRMLEDVATRFEVPVRQTEKLSLANLFMTLSSHGDFMEYTVERPSLESVFMKVIRENNIKEEDHHRGSRKQRRCFLC
ncbi:P-loop containing nucleoside triphosphate hydrolase protein [Pholiota conissans]|uniref:P-loop containing nucleoside triphosphate hydrolase protein n=1 Tax=Pholiota conissans TaxID=109636 RepID=A0A9P5YL26_9AGAR|nr:P-loop containing nucleoside triphosphate hydrolase protein [Pholiota conissans]